jgi:hypothetical protein
VRITLALGDVTEQRVDALVNAANSEEARFVLFSDDALAAFQAAIE